MLRQLIGHFQTLESLKDLKKTLKIFSYIFEKNLDHFKYVFQELLF